jgi:hypothetical protein
MIFVLRHWFWLTCAGCSSLQLLDTLLELILRDNCLLEWSLPYAVRQRQLCCQGNITIGDRPATFKGRLGTGGLKDDQVSPVTFNI